MKLTFKWLKDLFKPKKEGASTRCWCPICGQDLVSTNSYQYETNEGIVHYKCSRCETESQWNFDDLVPYPITVRK